MMEHLQYRHPKNRCQIILSILMVMPLIGCGFHLRDNNIKNRLLKHLNVVATTHDTVFYNVLQSRFQNHGITVQQDAPYQLEIISVQIHKEKQHLSNSYADLSFSGSVTWTLRNKSGTPLFEPRTNSQNTSLLENIGNVNTNEHQQLQTQKKLKLALADAVVRQVGMINSEDLQRLSKLAQQREEKHPTDSGAATK